MSEFLSMLLGGLANAIGYVFALLGVVLMAVIAAVFCNRVFSYMIKYCRNIIK